MQRLWHARNRSGFREGEAGEKGEEKTEKTGQKKHLARLPGEGGAAFLCLLFHELLKPAFLRAYKTTMESK